MKKGTFKNDGVITSRGEQVFTYQKGEAVQLHESFSNGNIQILVLEGAAKGNLVMMNEEDIQF